MGWKKILKSRTRPADIKTLGVLYALEEMYKSKLLSEEEYNKLPHLHVKKKGRRSADTRTQGYVSKINYHSNLYSFLASNKDSPSYSELVDYVRFHRTMEQRLRRDEERGEITPTYPTLEIFEQKGHYMNPNTRGMMRGRGASEKMVRMLRNLFNEQGLKTRTEVRDIIGRNLIQAELEALAQVTREYRRAKGRTAQIIIDYFRIYNNRMGRDPTVEDIERDEGRPLTEDELEYFETRSQR